MHRREFIELAASSVAAGALGACRSRSRGMEVAGAARAPMNAAAFHAERRFVETPFGSIAYVERGAGPAALFLHAFPLNGYQWRGALDQLAPHRRCIAPDLMGLGYSRIPDGQSVAPEAQVAMLVAVLDALSVSTVDLIGNDSGGATAQLFVARHPARVRTMLLTNCDIEPECPPQTFRPVITLAKQGVFADRSFPPVLVDHSVARSPRGIGPIAYTNPANPTDEAIRYYWSPLLCSPLRKRQVEAYAISFENNPLAGIEAALRGCAVPTRIVWGMADKLFSASNADYLDTLFAKSRGVRRIAEAKLYFPEEYPDVIAEEARALWG
jgi:pimeloyl-ACP methyl ester carboxylesterase